MSDHALTLLACTEADGWHGAVRDTWDSDAVTGDAVDAVAEVCEDGTVLRVVARDGPARSFAVVVGGMARDLVLSEKVRVYLSDESCAPWDDDPLGWLMDWRDGRDLLSVCGFAAEHEEPLRRRVVLAACSCARIALPVWEKNYPSDPRPRTAIETTESWALGRATIADVNAADGDVAEASAMTQPPAFSGAPTYAPTYAADAAHAAAIYAIDATNLVGAAADFAVAALVNDVARKFRTSTLARCARIVRAHVSPREVLIAMAKRSL